MRKLLNISALLLMVMLVLACSKSKSKKEIDAAAPTITITFPDNDDEAFSKGDDFLKFSGTVNDDLALEKLVVSLSWVGITKSAEIDGDGTVTSTQDPWVPEDDVFNLTGKSQSFSNQNLFGSAIPDNIKSGFYRITFQVTDAAKKSASVDRIVEIF